MEWRYSRPHMGSIGAQIGLWWVAFLFALMAMDGPARSIGIARAPYVVALMILVTLGAWWYEWRRGYRGYRLLVFAGLILAVAIARWPPDPLSDWLAYRLQYMP
jgi:hypothetical protein